MCMTGDFRLRTRFVTQATHGLYFGTFACTLCVLYIECVPYSRLSHINTIYRDTEKIQTRKRRKKRNKITKANKNYPTSHALVKPTNSRQLIRLRSLRKWISIYTMDCYSNSTHPNQKFVTVVEKRV